MSKTEAMTSGMMTAWLRRIGELAGFEFTTISYSLRNNAGNNLDQDVNISDALRNFCASINEHPTIVQMEHDPLKLPLFSDERRKAHLKIRSTEGALFKALEDYVRRELTDTQAVDDIERAIRGEDLADKHSKLSPYEPATAAPDNGTPSTVDSKTRGSGSMQGRSD
ncbi:hypothetical protein GGR57DRAFT_506255 [Xylariaceae sp. FL1272]|nr:hypothetical protein GGR57DRAFT_506255 [Xylariaceae sp. FL1272]